MQTCGLHTPGQSKDPKDSIEGLESTDRMCDMGTLCKVCY